MRTRAIARLRAALRDIQSRAMADAVADPTPAAAPEGEAAPVPEPAAAPMDLMAGFGAPMPVPAEGGFNPLA